MKTNEEIYQEILALIRELEDSDNAVEVHQYLAKLTETTYKKAENLDSWLNCGQWEREE